MRPADVTSPDAVLRAMREYDELGQDAFLAKYHRKAATKRRRYIPWAGSQPRADFIGACPPVGP
jgi:hypothetical protein